MRPLSPRERKLVAVLILVLAVSLVLTIVIGPLVSGFTERAARREALVQTFHANEQRIGSLNALQAEAERQIGQMRALFMAAPDAEEASEALRERIETAAQDAGGDIKSSEAVPAEQGWTRAAVDVRLSHAQLATLLARLNTLQPALAVDTLTVIADDALTNSRSDLLDVRLEATAPFVPAR
ncbi:type II secretion system protein GspM [Novosphingobium sp.]|uniref:type II secretion system protein GspM n=1 Tax=Novosphingobium sp. TaxID=1874826 RepID=UPI001D71EC67|nr:type II secretion system protein GspM [Novosphingobium sp.]MBX9665290.1 type II secretion system protein M [Novosphingobium sp.]